VNTLQSCQTQLDKLTQWRTLLKSHPEYAIASIDSQLEHSISTNFAAAKAAAEEWLKDLGNQCAQIYQLTDNTEKLEIANKLLKQIQAQSQNIELLSSTHQQSLKDIERQCIEGRTQSQSNFGFVPATSAFTRQSL